MAAFDYKKEYRDLYLPKGEPSVIDVPSIRFAAVRGQGNPNDADGEYAAAIGILYAISYTIKMSYKGSRSIDGYFEYVVPPLEGFWWMDGGIPDIGCVNKSGFHWMSMIRLPEFVTEEVFLWAKDEAAKKKMMNTALAELLPVDEGLCVQCMHIGRYDDEPATIAKINRYIEENGYRLDFSGSRRHHEIYLNDPRKTEPGKLKTIIRHPVVRI